jgi:DNA gyrase subunit A
MRLSGDDQVISMTILKGVSSKIEDREAYLSIPIETRLDIAAAKEFNLEELGVHLSEEQVIQMAEGEQFILTVSEKGFGKRSSAYGYRITDRGGSGVVNMDISDKTGLVVAAMPVGIKDELMLITNSGKLIRCKLETVRVTGRNTSGVILFKTDHDEKVVSAALIAEDESPDEESIEEEEAEEKSEEVEEKSSKEGEGAAEEGSDSRDSE